MWLQEASGARLERFYSAKSEVPRTVSGNLDDEQPIQPTSVEEPDDAYTAAPKLVRSACMSLYMDISLDRRAAKSSSLYKLASTALHQLGGSETMVCIVSDEPKYLHWLLTTKACDGTQPHAYASNVVSKWAWQQRLSTTLRLRLDQTRFCESVMIQLEFLAFILSGSCIAADACECGRHGVIEGKPEAAGTRQNRQGHGAALPAPQHGLPPRLLLRRPAIGARPFLPLAK